MRRFLPTPADDLDHDDLLASYAYPDLEARPWIRANMVATVDGSAVGPDGRSGSISTPADRRLFFLLRGLADVVLVGAGTARAEDYGPVRVRDEYAEWRARLGQTPAAVLAVISNRLGLDPAARMFTDATRPTMIFTSEASPAEARRRLAEVAKIHIVGERSVDLRLVARTLASHGLLRVLCEGGPTLLAELAATDLVDDLCLSVSPQLVAGSGPRTLNGPPVDVPLTLSHLLEEDSALFTRWTRVSS